MALHLVRDNIPALVSKVVDQEPTTIAMQGEEIDNALARQLCVTQIAKLAEKIQEYVEDPDDPAFDREYIDVLLADLKELSDTADRFSDRDISRMQVNLRKEYGGYDMMLMMEEPEFED